MLVYTSSSRVSIFNTASSCVHVCRQHGFQQSQLIKGGVAGLSRRTCSCVESGTREMASMRPRTSFAVFALGMAPNSGRSSVSSPRSACAMDNVAENLSYTHVGSMPFSRLDVAPPLQDATSHASGAVLASASFCLAYRSASAVTAFSFTCRQA